MAITGGEIMERYRLRKMERGGAFGRMRQIKSHYQGHISVPLPELDLNESVANANLIFQGIEQTAMRIASVQPQVICPPLKPGNTKSEDYARIRRLAISGWRERNNFDRQQRRRARHLISYATSPVLVRPNVDKAKPIPTWEVQDPFCTFPGPLPNIDSICPPDCILAKTRSLSWLQARYPAQTALLNQSTNPNPDEPYELIEWIDCDEHVLLAVGKPVEPSQTPYGVRAPQMNGAPWVELERFPNLVGRCTVIVPTRPSLADPQGQFDGMPALARMQARAMATWMISNERSVFPELWFVSRPNETVQIVQLPDGRAGVPGEVKGGDLKEITLGPPPQVSQMIDTLERNARVTAGIPTDYGGENPTNVRTGRAGDQLMSATVDFWIQEAQETLGLSYREENEIAIQVARAYFGSKPHSFYVDFGKAKGQVDYIPDVHFETDANRVAWPNVGSDVNSLAIGIGQRVGTGEMSLHTARTLDPYIDDPEEEEWRIASESMDKAMDAAIDQAIASGQIGPLEVGRMQQLVREGKSTRYDAFNQIHQEAQAQQAQAAQAQGGPGGPPGAPPSGGPPGPPGAGGPPGPPGGGQPGLMSPGMQQTLGVGPANPPGESIAPPSPSLAHMGQLLSTLRPRSDATA